MDPDPDQKLAKTFIFFICVNIFTLPHLQTLKGCPPSATLLSYLATNKVRKKFAIYEDLTQICILSVYSVAPPCR
jgi:hypothetical protein